MILKTNYSKTKCATNVLTAFLLLFNLVSCASNAGYKYVFDTGKYIDFGEGKWLINKTKSNSKLHDDTLNQRAIEQFTKILGDSLYEIGEVRKNSLIPSNIKFGLSKDELTQLGKDTDCDFLIELEGKTLTDSAGFFAIPSGNITDYASNQAIVTIKIYELKYGNLVSSSSAHGKAITRGDAFQSSRPLPDFNPSANRIMLGAAHKLIRRYNRYRIDK